MKWAQDGEVGQLTLEIRKLRQAINRVNQGLLNCEHAALYMDVSDVTFRGWVKKGLIAPTIIDPDTGKKKYSRAHLDQLIADKTATLSGEGESYAFNRGLRGSGS